MKQILAHVRASETGVQWTKEIQVETYDGLSNSKKLSGVDNAGIQVKDGDGLCYLVSTG